MERFSHEFNSILSNSGLLYICMYDQNSKDSIRFMSKGVSGLDSVYDPIVDHFKYSITVGNMNDFIDNFNLRIDRGKSYIYYGLSPGYLPRIDSPRRDLEVNYSIDGNHIEFDISGGLYNLFCTLLLIEESKALSYKHPQFIIGDHVLTNFGKAFVYDYLFDVKGNEIEYVCGLGNYNEKYDESFEYRSIPSTHIRFDRNYKIDKILK